jgi:hypothetical protein
MDGEGDDDDASKVVKVTFPPGPIGITFQLDPLGRRLIVQQFEKKIGKSHAVRTSCLSECGMSCLSAGYSLEWPLNVPLLHRWNRFCLLDDLRGRYSSGSEWA